METDLTRRMEKAFPKNVLIWFKLSRWEDDENRSKDDEVNIKESRCFWKPLKQSRKVCLFYVQSGGINSSYNSKSDWNNLYAYGIL